MHNHQILITEQQIQKRIEQLGEALNDAYKDQTIDLICILKGAVIFAADLVRELTGPVRMHFLRVTSYGDDIESSGAVTLHFSTAVDVKDRHVLIVDDILDTGITLDYLLKHLQEQSPLSLKTCVLLDKPERRKVDLNADYVGFPVPDHFVIGYGLDYQEFDRNLRYIAVLEGAACQK